MALDLAVAVLDSLSLVALDLAVAILDSLSLAELIRIISSCCWRSYRPVVGGFPLKGLSDVLMLDILCVSRDVEPCGDCF